MLGASILILFSIFPSSRFFFFHERFFPLLVASLFFFFLRRRLSSSPDDSEDDMDVGEDEGEEIELEDEDELVPVDEDNADEFEVFEDTEDDLFLGVRSGGSSDPPSSLIGLLLLAPSGTLDFFFLGCLSARPPPFSDLLKCTPECTFLLSGFIDTGVDSAIAGSFGLLVVAWLIDNMKSL
jgi:hypothetical protein